MIAFVLYTKKIISDAGRAEGAPQGLNIYVPVIVQMADHDENPDIDLDAEAEDDFEEMMDPMEALANFLTTDDGETIATSLAGLKDATEAIVKQLEKQNLILVKLLSAVGNMKGCECKAATSA